MAKAKRAIAKSKKRRMAKYAKPEHSGSKAVRYVPFFVAIFGLVALALIFFTELSPTPTGFVTKDLQNPVYCLKEGRDGLFHKVVDKGECCFLIQNTNACKAENSKAAYYFGDGVIEGNFGYKYLCIGGSSRQVVFGTIAKRYCGFEI